MIRKILIVLLVIITLLFNTSCSSTDKDVEKISRKTGFAIYLVKGVKTFEAIKEDINSLELEEEPILTDKNISEYIWNVHKFTLIKGDKLKQTLEEKIYMKVPVDGKPFVVVCNAERIYLGAFWTGLSSLSAPRCPIIMSDLRDDNSFEISYIYEKNDNRNDKRIYKVLKQLKKLK
jgi:hypothetical protein